MSETKDRNWSEQFAPPPPRPLRSRAAAPAAADPDKAVSEPEVPAAAAPSVDAGERRLSAVPHQSEPAASEVKVTAQQTAAPAAPVSPEAATAPDSTGTDGSTQATPATGSVVPDRKAVSDLLLEIVTRGHNVSLSGVRTDGAALVVDLEAPDGGAVALLEVLGEVSDALNGLEVTPEERDHTTPDRIRVRVLRAAAATATETEPTAAAVTPTSAPRSVGPAKQSVVYMPLAVRTAVDEIRERSGESFTAFVLGAFNRQYHRLEELFPRRLATSGPMPMGRSGTRKRRGEDTLVQAWVYLNDEQRAVLDAAVTQVNAGSRSALITKICEADVNPARL